MLKIAYMQMEELSDDALQCLLSCVEDTRREELLQRKNRDVISQSVAGEVLTRVLLSKITNIAPTSFHFLREQKGKPYQDTVPGLFFNYSHSAAVVACVIADQKVGIDIQKKMIPKEALKRRVLATEELNAVGEEADFTMLWCRKESYLKLTGEGIRRDLREIDTKKMKEEAVCTWIGGTILESYCLQVCTETKACGNEQNMLVIESSPSDTGCSLQEVAMGTLIKEVIEWGKNAEREN